MKPWIVVALLVSLSPAKAAETVFWGARRGETARVTHKTGINTTHARATLSPLADMPELNTVLRADCRKGRFTDAWGNHLQFAGIDRTKLSGGWPYIFTLDGERLSGWTYGPAVTAFRVLCPAQMPYADEIAPHD